MSYAELRLIAENYTASQKTRLANEGRIRSSAVDPDITRPLLELDKATEDLQAKALRKTFRKTVPDEIRNWQKASGGIGEHLLARLLGVIGDPYIAVRRYWREGGEGEHKRVLVQGEPFNRKVYNLYAYCGHGDPARRKFRGMSQQEAMALGSPDAKMLVHLLAESCMKQVRKDPETGEPMSTSKYRDVYNEARAKYDDKLHDAVCVRCGPSGKPAQPGEPWSLKHQHMAALRKVGKAVLKDLWVAARDAHLRMDAEAQAQANLPEQMKLIGSLPRTDDRPLTKKDVVLIKEVDGAREEQAAALG
jgi:hypothetical protein